VKQPSIISSGWWVALAAGGLSLAAGAVFVVPLLSRSPTTPGMVEFDLTDVTVPRELVVRAMNPDGVMTLNGPAMVDAAEVDRFNSEERGKMLVSDDRVIGVEIAGDARAYPLRLMRWHEVVNDVVGGEAVAVTYSPLCDSVAVFDREVDGAEVELGVSGLLYNSNTLLYARDSGRTASPLWVQLTGSPISGGGPVPASPLRAWPASLSTWADWRNRHPSTTVLAPLPEMKKPYKRDPFNSYFGSDLLRFPVEPLPPSDGPSLKDRVVIVTVDGESAVFALNDLAETEGAPAGSTEVVVAGLPLRIRFDAARHVANVEPLTDPQRLQSVRFGLWFAWYSLKGTIPGIIRDVT